MKAATFQQLYTRAREIRKKYAAYEIEKYGKPWAGPELMQGFVGEVGDLSKLILAKENQRDIQDLDSKLKHELADCLWSVIVLTDAYDVNLEEAFAQTMDDIEEKLKWESQK